MANLIKRNTQQPLTLEGNTISGYASVWYNPQDQGTEYTLWENSVERIDPRAFDDSLSSEQDVIASYDHDFHTLLGRKSSGTLKLSTDETGLKYEIEFDEADPDHQKIAAKIKRGDLYGSSFAALVAPEDYHHSTDNGKDVFTIRKASLRELGPVITPAYDSANVNMRSEDDPEQNKEMLEEIKEAQQKTLQILQRIDELASDSCIDTRQAQRLKTVAKPTPFSLSGKDHEFI